MAPLSLKVGALTPVLFVRMADGRRAEVAFERKRGIATLPAHINSADLRFGMPLDVKITEVTPDSPIHQFTAKALNIIDRDMLELMKEIYHMCMGIPIERWVWGPIVKADKYTSYPQYLKSMGAMPLREQLKVALSAIKADTKKLRVTGINTERANSANLITAVGELIKKQGILQVDGIAEGIAKNERSSIEEVKENALREKAEVFEELREHIASIFGKPDKPTGKKLDPETHKRVLQELTRIHPDKTGRPMTREEEEYMEDLLVAKEWGNSFLAKALLFIGGHDTYADTAERFVAALARTADQVKGMIDEAEKNAPERAQSYAMVQEAKQQLPELTIFVAQMLYDAIGDKEMYKKAVIIMLRSGARFQCDPFSLIFK